MIVAPLTDYERGYLAAIDRIEKEADEHQGQETADHVAHRVLRRTAEEMRKEMDR